MSKNSKNSQSEIIDEIRKARAEVFKEYKKDPEKFEEETKKFAKKMNLKYGVPKHKTTNEEDAA